MSQETLRSIEILPASEVVLNEKTQGHFVLMQPEAARSFIST
jgi:hypothetical protein